MLWTPPPRYWPRGHSHDLPGDDRGHGEKGYWNSPAGKTPAATLYSAMLKELTTQGSVAASSKCNAASSAAAASPNVLGHPFAPRPQRGLLACWASRPTKRFGRGRPDVGQPRADRPRQSQDHAQALLGRGGGMDCGTTPRPLPARCRFHAGPLARIRPLPATFPDSKNLSFLSLMALSFAAI